jgi:hypothetical protein
MLSQCGIGLSQRRRPLRWNSDVKAVFPIGVDVRVAASLTKRKKRPAKSVRMQATSGKASE